MVVEVVGYVHGPCLLTCAPCTTHALLAMPSARTSSNTTKPTSCKAKAPEYPHRPPQQAPAMSCEGDCSLEAFTPDANCGTWLTSIQDTYTTDTSPAELCPLGSSALPTCYQCLTTFFLVR